MPQYIITEKAGLYVAGRRNAGVGTVLELTEQQAQYELTLGTLRRAPAEPSGGGGNSAAQQSVPWQSFWQATWNGARISGTWIRVPSIFRLRLIGTGTVVIDSKNRQGIVISAVDSFTVNNATNEIVFPSLGDEAVEMRATFPATLLVEVLA